MTEHEEHDQALQRIAALLGVPTGAFHDPASPALQQARDTAELLQAFAQIDDSKVRQACIDFVRRCRRECDAP